MIVSTAGRIWWDWSLILWTCLPSVLWHCWLGHLTRKNLSPIWPIMCLCVWWDVKPYSINSASTVNIDSNVHSFVTWFVEVAFNQNRESRHGLLDILWLYGLGATHVRLTETFKNDRKPVFAWSQIIATPSIGFLYSSKCSSDEKVDICGTHEGCCLMI